MPPPVLLVPLPWLNQSGPQQHQQDPTGPTHQDLRECNSNLLWVWSRCQHCPLPTTADEHRQVRPNSVWVLIPFHCVHTAFDCTCRLLDLFDNGVVKRTGSQTYCQSNVLAVKHTCLFLYQIVYGHSPEGLPQVNIHPLVCRRCCTIYRSNNQCYDLPVQFTAPVFSFTRSFMVTLRKGCPRSISTP